MGLDVWDGKGVRPRKMMSKAYWKQPFSWQKKAIADGVRRKVFCASMADVFEKRDDLITPRMQLFDIIDMTPYLDWLLLTKRPQNVMTLIPRRWQNGGIPFNVWLGTSVENQHWADVRIPILAEIPVETRFLSCEPLLGAVNLRNVDGWDYLYDGALHWVIAGGESGPKHRPVHLDWLRSLRDQCAEYNVPYFMKQIGGRTAKSGGDLLDGQQYHQFPD